MLVGLDITQRTAISIWSPRCLLTTSEASAIRERKTEGTFNRHINQKITLPKLNDDSSTNDQWIWLADVRRYINSGCSMDILESEIDKSLSNGFWGVVSP